MNQSNEHLFSHLIQLLHLCRHTNYDLPLLIKDMLTHTYQVLLQKGPDIHIWFHDAQPVHTAAVTHTSQLCKL